MTRGDFDPEQMRLLREKIYEKQAELADSPAGIGLVPLKIACAMTSCKHGKHCLDNLRTPRQREAVVPAGSCRDCGTAIIDVPDWHEFDYADPTNVLNICLDQQHELIRAHYWHVPIDRWAFNRALRLGRTELLRRVRDKVVTVMTSDDAWASRSASYSRDIVSYAQHATATCCRNCAAYWHGLPRLAGEQPSRKQLDHVVAAAQAWVGVRLRDLPDSGQLVGTIRASSLPDVAAVELLDDSVLQRLEENQDPTGLLVPTQSRIELEAVRGGVLVKRPLLT